MPVTALRYCLGQLNYGGRVTDEWDTRAIQFILTDFVAEDIGEPEYSFDVEGLYSLPPDGADVDDYRKHIKNLPADDSPGVFGLHPNVNITASINDSTLMFSTLLLCQPRVSSGGGVSLDDVVMGLAKEIEAKLPSNFDVEDAQMKYPVDYENSMNTVRERKEVMDKE